MPERFRSLAATLLASRAPYVDEPAIEIVDEAVHVLHDPVESQYDDERAIEEFELVRQVRLFRACVIEGVEAAVETIVQDIATDVLGRELQLAPVDIEHITEKALQRYLVDEPVRVRVHPDEAASISCGVPVAADERLRAGDVLIELRCGSVDATLGVRLAGVLRKALS